jgi:hypothetical protein
MLIALLVLLGVDVIVVVALAALTGPMATPAAPQAS